MSNEPTHECEARPIAAAMVCDRCALAWDVGDTPPACVPLTFARMRAAAVTEAELIEGSAGAAVAAGFRQYRHQTTLKRSLELHGVVRLIDRCLNDREILSRLARTASKPKTTTAD